MKNYNYKILFATVISVLIILGTLVGAGVLAKMNLKGFSEEFPQTQYSQNSIASSNTENSSSVVSENSVSEQEQTSSVEEGYTENQVEYVTVETGSYFNGTDRILIKSSENGFVEGSVFCSDITMDFSGQTVLDTLVATGTDSSNNTVEITLIFEDNKIKVSSKPLIIYEESVSYLELSGIFKK